MVLKGISVRLRPGPVIEEGARVGNFVEIKKSTIGKGSKVNHLTYIGDAEIGKDVNIGAVARSRAIYDGFTGKSGATILEDGVFVGSNTNFVAPVRVGRGALIGAGSTITEDVKAEALAVGRAPQVVKAGWAKEFRRLKKKGNHHE